MNFIKKIVETFKSEENLHDAMFSSKDEIVEFDADAFEAYNTYAERNPNRFEVRYDRNLNRVWFY